jgi:hypothetical protein
MRRLLLLLLLAVPSFAAISVTQNCSNSSATTSVTCSFGSLPTVGHAIVVAGYSNANAVTQCADNQSNSYTEHISSSGRLKLYSAVIATSSGTFTMTCSTDFASQMALIAIDVSGLASSSIFDVGGEEHGYMPDTTDGIVTTATTAQADELVVGFLVLSDLNDLGYQGPNTGFTGIAEVNFGGGGMGGEYQIVSATGAQTISFASVPNYWGLYLVGGTFKAAADAPSIIRRRIM